MKAPESPGDPSDLPLVEDEWKRILTDFGVAEGPTDLLISGVLGGPDIRRNSPSKEQLRTLVERNLAESALESRIDDPARLEAAEGLLMDALDKAIEGKFAGPASAPREIAYSGVIHPVDQDTEQPHAQRTRDLGAETPDQPPSGPGDRTNRGAQRARADAGRGAWDAGAASVFSTEVPAEFEALSDAEQELVEYLWEFIETNSLDEQELAKAAAFVAMHDQPEDENGSQTHE